MKPAGRISQWAATALAFLLVCGFAVAQAGPSRARLISAGVPSGWTYNGTQALAIADAAIATNSRLYLDGANRVFGFFWDGAKINVIGTYVPGVDLSYNLGSGTLRWAGVYASNLNLSPSGALTDSATAPTISAGFGTSPSVTGGGTSAFRINVGTGGVATTGTIGLPAATTGWNCECEDVTTHSATVFRCRQTGAGTATSVPIGQFTSAAVAGAWVASDVLVVKCRAY